MLSQARILELYWLLLLLFLLLLSPLLGQFTNTILLRKASSSHLIILTSIFIIVVLILLVHVSLFVHVPIHVSVKPLILIVVVRWSVLHHAINRRVTRVPALLSFDVSCNFFLDSHFLLVKLRRLVLSDFAHKS
jgi:hypothetical protein